MNQQGAGQALLSAIKLLHMPSQARSGYKAAVLAMWPMRAVTVPLQASAHDAI